MSESVNGGFFVNVTFSHCGAESPLKTTLMHWFCALETRREEPDWIAMKTPEMTEHIQAGIRDAENQVYTPTRSELLRSQTHEFTDIPPLSPEDSERVPPCGLTLPAKALRVIDRIEAYVPDGGPKGLGSIKATKRVDPDEWFFDAHFYQDPVLPGSLGIESFIQLLKYVARQRWPHLVASHRFGLLPGKPHTWVYRGQILPKNRLITVEVVVTDIKEHPRPTIMADGYLQVDGLYIYKMEDFGINLGKI